MKHLPLLILLLAIGWQVNAQDKNAKPYLYLEVHKELPVQVKINGQAVQNNRKGYIIIPSIPRGDNQLDFSFTNPNFKDHSFTINTGTGKSLGLKLMQVSKERFVLQNVVNKQILTDNATLNTKPILALNTIDPTKQKNASEAAPKRGIIKVYRSGENNSEQKTEAKKTSPKKKKVKKAKTNAQKTEVVINTTAQPSTNAQTSNTPAATQKKATYAMYRYRKPLTEQVAQRRYKDYGKARRARKRKNEVERVEKKNNTQIEKENVSKKIEKSKAKDQKRLEREKNEKELALQEKIRQEKLAREKEIKKQEREITRAKKQRQRELKRIQAEQEEANRQEQDRIAKAQRSKEKQTRKAKKLLKEKEQANADNKVINSEPVNTRAQNKNTSSKDQTYPIRCTSVVNQERVADWMVRINKKYDDEARTNYIRRKLGNKCISTNNLGLLLGNLETQIGRYKMIRTLYPQLDDRANVDRLYKYFQSTSYINKLKELEKQSIY